MATKNVFDIAAFILSQKHPLPTPRLHKLLHYCQAWSLVWDEQPLFGNTAKLSRKVTLRNQKSIIQNQNLPSFALLRKIGFLSTNEEKKSDFGEKSDFSVRRNSRNPILGKNRISEHEAIQEIRFWGKIGFLSTKRFKKSDIRNKNAHPILGISKLFINSLALGC